MSEVAVSEYFNLIQTLLRLTGCKLGYLLNFGEALMKNGITRAVDGLEEST
jgi:hypothetical protein